MKNILLVFVLHVLLLLPNLQAQTKIFQNPILPGAYPDPSITRVGEDYYLSNSSFEYFPGIPLWHSKDLVHWENIGFGIQRSGQFNFEGLASSAGAWAPTIRYNQEVYYLAVTWVDWRMKVGFKNVILTATNPAGPWSNPYTITDTIWGIDPALFFDDDGKAYWLMNHPAVGFKHEHGNSIMLQEIDLKAMKLIGKPSFIGRGAMLDSQYPEGPKLFKKDGFYYLLIAEGGTGINHAVTISRSKTITGPYENFQGNPILTHRMMGYSSFITNVGHADLLQTSKGEWWMVCLGSRPLAGKDNILGRETFLVPVTWDKDQWPVVSPGFGQVRLLERLPDLPMKSSAAKITKDEFESEILKNDWSFIRIPAKDFYSLNSKKGFLSLKLLPAQLSKLPAPAFVGQRLKYRSAEVVTRMTFNSRNKNEQAGLAIYKSENAHLTFTVSKKEKDQELSITSRKDSIHVVLFRAIIKSILPIQLKISQQENKFTFHYQQGESAWQLALKDFTGSLFGVEESGGFMGAFAGLYASSNGIKSSNVAQFDWFEYLEK